MIVRVEYKQKRQYMGGSEVLYTLYRIIKYKKDNQFFYRTKKAEICNNLGVSDRYYKDKVFEELSKDDDELVKDIKKSLGIDQSDNVYNLIDSELRDTVKYVNV